MCTINLVANCHHLVILPIIQVNAIITELKSDAVKDRHWKSLMKQLRVRWTLSELTLAHVWDVDVERNEKIIRDVLLVAQGERALEEFLRQVCLFDVCCYDSLLFFSESIEMLCLKKIFPLACMPFQNQYIKYKHVNIKSMVPQRMV